MTKAGMVRLYAMMAALALSVESYAQTVLVQGKVINLRNEPVAGATIKVEETNKQFSANVEGMFRVSLEKGKKYSLLVSSTGYNSKLVSDIDANSLNEDLVIVLEPKVVSGEAIVIRSTRRQESTVALISFQKNNTSLSNGLAADFIKRTPDKNTGEVLKRVSGASIQDNRFVIVRGLSDRYNSAMLNGALLPSTEPDKKAFSFDMLPAAMIDNIIINKTATPEYTGEFSGGLVQVNTRDIPTKRVFSVGIGFGYNNQSTLKDFTSNARNRFDWLGFDDGSRNLPDSFPKTAQEYRTLGKNAAGLNKQIELTKLFSGDAYVEEVRTAEPIKNYVITYANTHSFKNGGQLGTLLSVNYRNARLMYNVGRAFYEADGKNVFEYNDQQNHYQVTNGAVLNLSYVQKRSKISFKNIFNQFYEDNYYSRTGYNTNRLNDIRFYSSFLNQRTLFSTQLEGEHQLTKTGIKFKWNGNGGYNWKKQPDLRSALYARRIGTNEAYEIDPDDTRRFYSDLKDFSVGTTGQFIVPMSWGGKDKQTLKFGGSNLTRVRDFRSRIFRYNITNFNSFIASNANKDLIAAFRPTNMGISGYILEDFTNNQDRYFGASVLNAAYMMLDNKFSDLRLVWGLRAENFQQLLTSKIQTGERSVLLTKKWDFLPSANLMYSLNSKQNFRLSASRTVARPEFRELAPFAFFDYETNYGVKGDTSLRRSSVLNYDARYEWYPKSNESITIGAFYKDFTDPIEFRLDPASNADSRRYFYQNATSARTYGLEIEVRKGMEFLSPSLKNLFFFGNYTLTSSEVRFNDLSAGDKEITAARPLQGQSPYLINAGFQWTSEKFNASLLYNRVGERLALVGNTEFPNVYERPRNQLDFQISKKILSNNGELKLNIADMINNPFYFYENIDQSFAFKKGVDRMFSNYKPGTTVTLTFTYDFDLDKK
ncbi:MAG: outer membrane beta-barrel protein [Bacteroidota bacterium]|jgi:outer membrane receptor protein involved in Fe transport